MELIWVNQSCAKGIVKSKMSDGSENVPTSNFSIRDSSRVYLTNIGPRGIISGGNTLSSGGSLRDNLYNAIRERVRNYLPRNESEVINLESHHPARATEEYFDRSPFITTNFSRQGRSRASDVNTVEINTVPRLEVIISSVQRTESNIPSESSNSSSTNQGNSEGNRNIESDATSGVNGNSEPNDRSNGGNNQPSSSNQQSSPLNLSTMTVGDVFRQSPETRAFLGVIFKYLPFVLILVAKGLYDHRVGILVLAGMILTFSYGNMVVKREAGKQSRRSISSLARVFFNLLACITFVYFIFQEQRMHLSLFMIPPYTQPLTICDLFWLVCVTDLVLKMITVIMKGFLVSMPPTLISYQKRGKWFHFIEITSQTYRSLCPIQPWLYYLIEAYQGTGKVFGVLLCAAYVVSKITELFRKGKAWKFALMMVLQDLEVGVRPSAEELLKAGNQCPICQDTFTSPILLSQGCGRHIFCEACILHWLDRERSCPLCRAKIPTAASSFMGNQRSRDVEHGPDEDDEQDEAMPLWRDGSTTHILQVY
ncbi:hypothetical protein J437_LFUL014987 [Ladona fulva]|uniref:RING-type domain-containing protein n=1 Tax=Ladona fulva TaxID=123851 RepID=A0A8K0KHE0_LADFU|nr:hypothetical protein J437_LFUL014987 [Ladona fulva]